MDRGSTQPVGIVSDAEPFLRTLMAELENSASRERERPEQLNDSGR